MMCFSNKLSDFQLFPLVLGCCYTPHPIFGEEVGRHVADPLLLSLERDVLREISQRRAERPREVSPALAGLVTTFETPFAVGFGLVYY
jgi:hypothetical protein